MASIPEIKSQPSYLGPLAVVFHLDHYKEPVEYFTLNKWWQTNDPIHNFNMAVTFNLEEARLLSSWLQEILIQVEDIKE